ncbi:Ldh family oxidoreductase [Pseudorhodobacter sp. E13]|uniref:Ldh family oxidoreductase n=1 Tax=Pseudorhodobacter sp. E13 TaxID=2487931 RepID=UPI000F8E392A|nr:Ldh family oxidoreductase [Pseudorhodobacter sp. E13]RUS63541.1 Ldh family oxidoreductase [Pseudorhodobacter sp. E13]
MQTRRAEVAALGGFCEAVFRAVGADAETARDATRSMMHGSLHGVDSHGVRLLPYYARVLEGGEVAKAPQLRFTQVKPGSGLLDAGHAQGARATYHALELAIGMAATQGIAAVGIQNSSHFGPAGAYAYAAAERGYVALVVANSDSFVRLHDGAERFHGTNPIAVGVPTGEANPWLLDMATSSVPFNRVELYQSLGVELPPDTASDAAGAEVLDPHQVAMLAPVGGTGFGFKGAALGGVAEIFSAALTGMRLSPEIPFMGGEDHSTPRVMGAFVMVMDPEGFIGGPILRATMQRYLAQLRGSKPREGARVLAPGDREWAEAAERRAMGVPLDPLTVAAFEGLSARFGVGLPW